MKVILIQGKENAGKTTLCKKIEKWLIDYFISRGGLKLERQLNYSNKRCDDFLGVYENISDEYCIKKQEKLGSKIEEDEKGGKRENKKIIINSASDNNTVIDCFKDFFINNQDNCDVLITAIRDQGSLCKKIEDVYRNDDKDKNGQKIVKVQAKLPEKINLDNLKSKYSSSTFIEDVFLNEFIPEFFK